MNYNKYAPSEVSVPEETRYPAFDENPKPHLHKLNKVCVNVDKLARLKPDHFLYRALMAADYETVYSFRSEGIIVELGAKVKLTANYMPVGYVFYKDYLDLKGNTLNYIKERSHWYKSVKAVYRPNRFLRIFTILVGACFGLYEKQALKACGKLLLKGHLND